MNRRHLAACLCLLLCLLGGPGAAVADTVTGNCPTIAAGGTLARRAPALSADGSRLYLAIGGELVAVNPADCNADAIWAYAGVGAPGVSQLVPDAAHGKIWALKGFSGTLTVFNDNGSRYSDPATVTDGALGRAALRQGTDLLYIPVPGSGTVAVHQQEGLLAGTISTGGTPSAVAISPDGTRGYVADQSGGAVTLLDLTSGTATWQSVPLGQTDGTIAVGQGPVALALSADGGTLLVSNADDDTVSIIDTATESVVATVPVTDPSAIALAPDETRAFVASASTGSVVVLDLVHHVAASSISVGGSPQELALSPSGDRLFAGQVADGQLADIDLDVPPAITTPAGSLPGGHLGVPYSAALTATGSPAPAFSVSAGHLPTGLTLGTDGTISGTPTAAGTAAFTVSATATVSGIVMTATRATSIVVPAPPPAPVLPASWVKRWPVKTGPVRTARIGRRVAVTRPVYSASGQAQHPRVSYQWYLSGKPVTKATGQRFLVRKAHHRKVVSVRITISRAGYRPRTLTIGFGRAR